MPPQPTPTAMAAYAQQQQQHQQHQQHQQPGSHPQQYAHRGLSAQHPHPGAAAGAPSGAPPPPPSTFEPQPDGNEGLRQAKRRRPTDRTLPSFISPPLPSEGPTAARLASSTESLRVLSSEYAKMQQVERKLDWNVSRRRIELQEALSNGRILGVKRSLRVHLQIQAIDQPWQVLGKGEGELRDVPPAPPRPPQPTPPTAAPSTAEAEAISTATVPTEDEKMRDGEAKDATMSSTDAHKNEEDKVEVSGESSSVANTTTTEPASAAAGTSAPASTFTAEAFSTTAEAPSTIIDASAPMTTTTGPDFAKGTGVPRFTVKISGELLGEPEGFPKRPLTAFTSRIVVDTDRDPALYDRAGAVEWIRPPPIPGAPLPVLPHALSLSFPSSTPTKLRLSFYLDHRPERFALAPEVAQLLDMRLGDRIGVSQALWGYIKMHGLQDPDMKHIRTDDRLRKLFSGQERVPFHHLPEYVNRFLAPCPPVTITHLVDLVPSSPTSYHAAYDLPLYLEDTSRLALEKILITLNTPSPDLSRLDESLAASAIAAKSAHLKRSFLIAFASDPSLVLSNYLSSQANDLHKILSPGTDMRGSSAAIGGEAGWREDARRSETWQGHWVKEGASMWASRLFEQSIRDQVGLPSTGSAANAGGGAGAGGGKRGR